MGTVDLIGKKLTNNDDSFFKKFTTIRKKLESLLIEKKDLIATVLQRHLSPRRVPIYSTLLNELISKIESGVSISDEDIIAISGLAGKLIVGTIQASSREFSDDAKSKAFLHSALCSAMKCPICEGYLDASKSATYDHIQEKSAGGLGAYENCQMVHPYCNSAVKNSRQ
jgi:hypothetical protein